MFRFHEKNGCTIAELTNDKFVIRETQDILDLMADLSYQDCNRIILNENNLSRDFFDLKTKLAGEVLQKISNYRFMLAIIGDFSKHTSKSLTDFFRESNRGNRVWFVNDLQEALEKF
ncbi:MAG: DUF4180 domain-containing protein [Bacteroidota bacterium]